MVSQADIDRLCLEADTIVTRYSRVERPCSGPVASPGALGHRRVDHHTGHQSGDSIELTLELDADPSSNARSRYDRGADLEAELERQDRVVDRVATLPADSLAYLND